LAGRLQQGHRLCAGQQGNGLSNYDLFHRLSPDKPNQSRFGAQAFKSADSDEDDGFGPFSDSFAARSSPPSSSSNPFDTDPFAPTTSSTTPSTSSYRPKLTPADFNSAFKANFDEQADFDDDFGGDFSEAPTTEQIVLPTIEHSDEDYDFSAHWPETSTSTQRAGSTGEEASTTRSTMSPSTSPRNVINIPLATSPPASADSSVLSDLQATALATSPDQPLGPGVADDAKVESDGMISRVVEGQEVTVPADEIALAVEAERRSSSSGSTS
jgi:hypothetical protein